MVDNVLTAFEDLLLWTGAVTPSVPLMALPVLAGLWLVTRSAKRFLNTPSPVVALAQRWFALLSLSCIALVFAWLHSEQGGEPGLAAPTRWPGNILTLIALAGPAHALRSTLATVLADTTERRSPLRTAAAGATWAVFCGTLLLCLHGLLMWFAFPFGGGEFHAMFAYTDEGRIDAAVGTWRVSVLILGLSAIVFAAWIPLPWWAVSLVAIAIGANHWWDVYTWQPQSPGFHQAASQLLFAMPVSILLLSGMGAWVSYLWERRRHDAERDVRLGT